MTDSEAHLADSGANMADSANILATGSDSGPVLPDLKP